MPGSWTFSNDIFINGIPPNTICWVSSIMVYVSIGNKQHIISYYMVNNYKGHYFLLSGLHWLPKFRCFLSGKWMMFSSFTIWHPFPWSCAYGYFGLAAMCDVVSHFKYQLLMEYMGVSSNGGTPETQPK